MYRLIEVDLVGIARAVLRRVKALDAGNVILDAVEEVLSVRAQKRRRLTAPQLAEFFELPEDDRLSNVADWLDERVRLGDRLPDIRARLEHVAVFFDVMAEEGAGEDHVRSLFDRLGDEPRAPLSPTASREEIKEHLLADAYTATVMRRVFGLSGISATREFLWDLYSLGLTRDDEARIAELIASIGYDEVLDQHAQIIAPLREHKRGGLQ